MPDTSIIIVNYNTGDLLQKCIRSIVGSVTGSYEVIVVDNASTDSSIAFLDEGMAPPVRLLRSPENLGFAAANNWGAREAGGEVLHFLNPDTELDPSINQAYRTAYSAAEEAIYATRLVDENGAPVKGHYVLPTLRAYAKAFLRIGRPDYWYLGASVLLQRDLFWRLGAWPTDYFLYGEDLDLFYRAWRQGVPARMLDVAVMHYSGGTTRQIWDQGQRLMRTERAGVKFARKYDMLLEYCLVRSLALLRSWRRSPAEARVMLRAFRSALRERQ